MIFGYSLTPFGHHPGAWKHARDGRRLQFDALLDQVLAAEASGLDFILLADRLGLRPVDDLSSVAVPFEPTLLASALATRTARIGIVAAASTAQHEPYNLARRFASLDLISNGRAGWLVVAADGLPARESEYVEVVTDLWNSFDDDAFLYDKTSGRFFDPAKMHVANHNGAHFSVRGPLNVNPSPQGRPVLAQLLDEYAMASAAHDGELLLLPATTAGGLIDIAHRTLKACGKARNDAKLLGNILPFVAPSVEAADAASEALTLSERDRATQALAGIPIVGTSRMIADQMQELAATASLDGFTVLPPTLDMGARFFADVVPELEKRGLINASPGGTLRDRLGLTQPRHPSLSEKAGSR